MANRTAGPLFRNSGICFWFRHLKHVLQSPNSLNSLWCFSYKNPTKMPVIKFIFLIVIELPSFVACRRYGFSRQSKAEKVRKAWLMGENVWETQVLLPFASVPRGQAPSRGGTAGPWSLGNPGQRGCTSSLWPLNLPRGIPSLLPVQAAELRQHLIMGLEVKGDWKSWHQGQTDGL